MRHLLWIALLAPLAACSTPASVKQLSLSASDSALRLASELQNAARVSGEIEKGRVSTIQLSYQDSVATEVWTQSAIGAATEVNDPAVARYNKIMKFVEAQETKFAKSEEAQKARIDALQAELAAQPSVKTELMSVGSDLVTLGADDSKEAQRKIALAFVIDVAKKTKAGIDAAKKDAEKSAEAAKPTPK